MDDVVCDLILLSWNHLEELEPCVETLLSLTVVPSRLILVDNASTPEVRSFAASLRPRGAIREVVVIQNDTNEGFPRGMNRGLAVSNAPYVCLLNNDLRFTRGWLREMLAVAESDPSIGVVNPTSNTFGNLAPRGVSLQAYADSLQGLRGEYREVGMCLGFCMLIKRAVLDRVGQLSEEVERCFFEDEDFCMRAQAAGFRCVVASAAYVYHQEHRSVRDVPEREELFRRNRRWCEARWGRRLRIAWPRFEPLVPGSEELREWLERLRAWARRRTHVYVFCPSPRGLRWDELFRSVGLVPHADIHWCPIPRRGGPLAATAWILKRRKKPFDLIAAPEPTWAGWMHRLSWLHGAEIVAEQDEEHLRAVWNRKAQSPSSS